MAVNPDKYESNNSMATATPLTKIHGSVTGLTLHSGDEDYFKFTLKRSPVGKDVIAVSGNVALELYDKSGNQLSSSSYGSLYLSKYDYYQPGTYYLKVYDANSNVVPSYTLKYDLPSAQLINADSYEKNGGNNTLATATAITGASGSFKNLSVHNDADVDYFKIHLNKDGSADDVIIFNYVRDDGPLSITLLNSAGKEISHEGTASSYSSYENSPTISFAGKGKGDYYIKVEQYDSYDKSPNNYSLSWAMPSNFVPKADKYENNDTRARAKTLTAATGTIKNLTHHTEKDADFFKYKLTRTGKSYDKISVNSEDANVYLQLFNSAGKSLKKGKSVSLSGQKAGTYYVKAYNADGDYTKAYSLSWNFNPLKDKYEDNNARSRATALSGETGTIKNLTHHTTTDADYFKFTLDHKGVSKDKISVSGDSNVTLQLINGGKVLKTGKSISLQGQKAGTYYVKAYNAKKLTTDSYSLAWDFAPPKDVYEGSKGNNSKGTASLLKAGTGTLKNLTHHTGKDADWFKFTLAAKGKSNNFISVAGDKDVYFNVYDSKGVACTPNYNNTSSGYTFSNNSYYYAAYNFKDMPAGTYYIKTFNESGNSTRSYSLSWDFNPPKDAFESNDSIKTATKLYAKQGKVENLTHHTAKDADFFKFTLDSKGTSKDKITISGDSAVTLKIFNGSGKEVKGAGKTLNMSGLAAGTYYAKAYNSKNKITHSYTLSWDLNAGTKGDIFEKNNSLATATLLPGDGSVTGKSSYNFLIGSIHSSADVDYYKIHLDQKGTADDKVTMLGLVNEGNLDMQLLNSKGKVIATSNNVGTQSEDLSLANRAAGDYYVKVYGYNGATSSRYSLDWYLPSSSQASTTHYYGSIAAS